MACRLLMYTTALSLLLASTVHASSRPKEDAKAPSRSFLTTFIASVRHHRRSLTGDGRFVVHMVGALRSVEGRISWAYAGYEVCDRTTIVLVGRQMPDTNPKRDPIDGCEVRHVRGEWNAAALERGLPDERERRPDLVLLFNADAYTCPWRRTLHALLQPRDDLRHSLGSHRLGGPSGAPVVITTYAANEAQSIQRIVSNPGEWFSKGKLEECDAITRTIYGAPGAGEGEEGKQEEEEKEEGESPVPQPALLHWRAGVNAPEDNAAGTANSHWLSFSPGELASATEHMPTVQRDWHVSGAAVLLLIVGLMFFAMRQTARRWIDDNPDTHARIRARSGARAGARGGKAVYGTL